MGSMKAAVFAAPGRGVLSSLGVYSGKLSLPPDAFAAGLGDHRKPFAQAAKSGCDG
jgi:hypothetical protein